MSQSKGKFFGVNSDYINNNVYSLKTSKGATKVGGKIKFGGAEPVENQFVIDAIDIDWGGLSLTSLYNDGTASGKGTKNIELHKIDSNDENQNRDGIGILSTGYALAKLSDSFTNIVGVIGANDTAAGTVRRRVADLEASVHTLTGGNTSTINDIMGKITRIEEELSYSDKVTNWVTWVDSLKAFDKGTNVRKYIDDINSSLTGSISSKADSSTVGQISARVGTLETTVGADDTKGLRKKVAYLITEVGNESSGLVKKVADLDGNKADANIVSGINTRVGALEATVGDASSGLVLKANTNSTKIANLNNTKADKDTVSGISAKVGALETTVGADDAHGLRQKIAELNTNKASVSTVNLLLSVVYPNGNTAKTSYIQTYALPAYYIAWENKTAIENLKTSGISATRMVDADGNGILVFKSLSTS